jgi:hypothetical protein
MNRRFQASAPDFERNFSCLIRELFDQREIKNNRAGTHSNRAYIRYVTECFQICSWSCFQEATMAGRELLIGPAIGYPFETGARIFAALAFPELKEDDKRKDAETAWVASYLHRANEGDEDTSPFLDNRLNEQVALKPAWCRQKLRTAQRRLKDRFEAARAVRPWMQEYFGLAPHRPIAGVKKFTQRQIAMYLCGSDEEKAIRFQERVWRVSRPVLHVAIALDFALVQIGAPDSGMGIDLGNIDLFRKVVLAAANVQLRVTADPRFQIDPETQINFVWKE